jgi:hypothetical protein
MWVPVANATLDAAGMTTLTDPVVLNVTSVPASDRASV